MSRIIIKNLPVNISEDKLKKHFSSLGNITDIKILKTKEGKSRKLAFIGYHNDTDAHKAVKYFNKSFIDSSKMLVEMALPFGDASLAKPWNKQSVAKSINDNINRKKKKKGDGNNDENPELGEFLSIHQKNRAIWSNDEHNDLLKIQTPEKNNATESESSDHEYDANDNLQKHLENKKPTVQLSSSYIPPSRCTVVLKGIPFSASEADVRKFFRPLTCEAVRLTQDKKGRPSGKCFVDFKSDAELRKSLKYNKRYMGTRYVEVFRDTGTKAEKEGIPQNQRKNIALSKTVPQENNQLSFGDSGQLFVRNLPYECTEDELKEHFEQIGPLSSIDLPISKGNRNKGIAYVAFLFPEHAIKALNNLTFKPFQGRLIHIMSSDKAEDDDEQLNENDYKSNKKLKEKQKVMDKKSWNTLFLNQNAVSDYLSQKLGVAKSEILDGANGNASVSLALAETQLLQEIKDFLEKEGVDLESFSGEVSKRSKKVIVCKNIPFGTQERELHELFSSHGSVGRVVLPPTGTIALIEFLDSSEATKAFRKLAFSKFKYVPLYLEWAPESTFSAAFKPSDRKVYKTLDDDLDAMDHATLFVKNLNFDTTDDDLKDFFKGIAKVSSVSIAKKPNPKSPSGFLSRGYGFIEFVTKTDAKEAMKRLNGKILKDYAVELKLSEKKLSKAPESIKKSRNLKEGSSKLLIKNVPFETTVKDLRKLFGAFGEIKNIRLPRKIAGSSSHRGFGFVEYCTLSEARAAFKATSDSTHIFGRRLVVEWAKEDETVEEIRARTADNFVPDEPSVKKQKIEDLL